MNVHIAMKTTLQSSVREFQNVLAQNELNANMQNTLDFHVSR